MALSYVYCPLRREKAHARPALDLRGSGDVYWLLADGLGSRQ